MVQQLTPQDQLFRYRSTLLLWMALWLLFLCIPGRALSAMASPSPTITLAFSTEPMAPYYTVSEDSQEIGGPWRRMLDELFINTLGWQVRYIIRPWQRAQNEVKVGNADAFISIITDERLQYASPISTAFCCFPLHLFTWKGHPKFAEMKGIGTVNELAAMDLELVSNLGNGWYKKNIEQHGVKTTWLPTDEQVLRFVAMQRGDGLIDLPSSMAHLATRLDLNERIIDTGVSFGKVEVHLMIGNASPLAGHLAEIDSAMKALQKDGTFTARSAEINNPTGSTSPFCGCGEGQ